MTTLEPTVTTNTEAYENGIIQPTSGKQEQWTAKRLIAYLDVKARIGSFKERMQLAADDINAALAAEREKLTPLIDFLIDGKIRSSGDTTINNVLLLIQQLREQLAAEREKCEGWKKVADHVAQDLQQLREQLSESKGAVTACTELYENTLTQLAAAQASNKGLTEALANLECVIANNCNESIEAICHKIFAPILHVPLDPSDTTALAAERKVANDYVNKLTVRIAELNQQLAAEQRAHNECHNRAIDSEKQLAAAQQPLVECLERIRIRHGLTAADYADIDDTLAKVKEASRR